MLYVLGWKNQKTEPKEKNLMKKYKLATLDLPSRVKEGIHHITSMGFDAGADISDIEVCTEQVFEAPLNEPYGVWVQSVILETRETYKQLEAAKAIRDAEYDEYFEDCE